MPSALWTDTFLVELRVLGVTGPRIGAALAEVEAHCADSGESPWDAFGDPVDYARALDLPREAAKGPGPVTVAAVLCAWTGVLIWFKVSDTWREGDVSLTVGNFAAVGLLVVLGVALVLVRARAENTVLRAPVALQVVAVGVVAAAVSLVSGSFPDVVARVDRRVLALVGTGLLLLDMLLTRLPANRPDPVVAPPGSRAAGAPSMLRADRLLTSASPLVPVVVAATFAVLGFWG